MEIIIYYYQFSINTNLYRNQLNLSISYFKIFNPFNYSNLFILIAIEFF